MSYKDPHRRGKKVTLVRHGETEWSRKGLHTGLTDVPLTDEGRRVAASLESRLAHLEPALVLASPLARARETAALAGFPDAEIEPDLVEVDYGDAEGRRTREIREERPGWDVWREGAPNGEPWERVGERADRVIARIEGAGGDVIVFAHGHILRVLAARWLEQPPAFGGRLALSTAAICDLGYERERRVVWLWNDTAHLTG